MATIEQINSTEKVSEFIEAYDFEVYDILKTRDLVQNLRPVMYASIAAYLFFIYYGQKWMKNRPAYKLNTALFLWNVLLSVLSIAMVLRGYPEAVFFFSQPNGLYLIGCSGSPHNYATSFWGLVFLLSKLLEFGDTAFIVLRKQKLIVLHWFHHVATLLMCWIGFEYYDAMGRLFFVNAGVHSLMYPYYALRALKVTIPRKIAMTLTAVQIAQMFFGLYANYVSVEAMRKGLPCARDWNIIYLVGAVVASFTVLFINFFINTYFTSRKSKTH